MALNSPWLMVISYQLLSETKREEIMKFRDDFSASFVNQETFMQFLDQVEVNAQWQNYPTNTLKVFSAEENLSLIHI